MPGLSALQGKYQLELRSTMPKDLCAENIKLHPFTALVTFARAHQAAWVKSMYCLNGDSDTDDENTNTAVTPLYNLTKSEWWFHNNTNCPAYPPADGEFLELPAGGTFTVEIAQNRAFTTLSYDGELVTDWPDGGNYPANYSESPDCITSPNLHTQNESMAAGTAFAIAYKSEIEDVEVEDLVVFSTLQNTPFKRLATYEVPAALPACPDEGCICAWGWYAYELASSCGTPNMYHEGFRCTVVNATGTVAVGAGQAPVWCEDDASTCVSGPKQMLYWNQLDGNNIEVDGYDLAGMPKSPAYGPKCGFSWGAQNDIFTGDDLSRRYIHRNQRKLGSAGPVDRASFWAKAK
ncbi:hypothetical protein FISHEDRAFT_75817 [Fistulina hepatica ATCC 64428]|uniref:Uncharacterized protein n=1 Tax=Fistulina hepatica ATCC 64428 TaxID=1128425 RepID=A0A0D7A5F7_9AGAR|nr:hypothetical protein FISHEDRAFT_75817 [Fistulina hepatica ATCC 64428]